MELEIETGIDIPPPTRRGSGDGRWSGLRKCFERMSVGNSVVFPFPSETVKRTGTGYIYSAASAAKVKICTRRIDPDNIRIWRIE